ncbi:MAG: 2-oxoacid:acceptor oxidoreductase family protein [Desulfobacteraceae bacterium]
MPNNTIDQSLKLRIFCTGVGGQGTLLASRVLGEAGLTAGYSVLVSETHGMAQRAGSLLAVNMVLLGALAQTERLSFLRGTIVQTITRLSPPKYMDTNLEAFRLGVEAAAQQFNTL